MIVVVATVRVKPGKAEAYEALCRNMIRNVRATEPGAAYIEVARQRDMPDTYRVIEVYRDQAAMEAHQHGPLLKEAGPALYACMDGAPQVTVHDSVS